MHFSSRRAALAALFASVLLTSSTAFAQYKQPPKSLVDLVSAPSTPLAILSPDRKTMLLVENDAYPPLSLIARPFESLAGLRIDGAWSSLRRTSRNTSITILDLTTGKATPLPLPKGCMFNSPSWSPKSDKFVFTENTDGGLRLWVADLATATAKPLPSVLLTDILGGPFSWLSDGNTLLVRAIPAARGKTPAAEAVPDGPVIMENNGRRSRNRTYQDLLDNNHESELFEYYATTQLATLDLTAGTLKPFGKPGLFSQSTPSPDSKYVLTTRIRKPFSFRVPASNFPRVTEVLSVETGEVALNLANLPVADNVPPNGVATGPRALEWDEHSPSTLLWSEALDRGDPNAKPEAGGFRDKVMIIKSPFKEPAVELTKLKQRYTALDFTGKPNQVLITETDRTRRWRTTYFLDLTNPESKKVLFDLSSADAYRDPGSPVYITSPQGRRHMLQDGDWIFLSGSGDSPEGQRPFLDKVNLTTGEVIRLFQSPADANERFIAFATAANGSPDFSSIITQYQSPVTPPNYYLRKLGNSMTVTTRPTTLEASSTLVKKLTDFKDPHPELTGIKKQLITYTREDGVPLSFTLYTPPGFDPAKPTPLPTIFWAYPREYTDDDTAGQVRTNPNAFTRLAGYGPLMYLTQGYAVMMDVAMPVVGPTRKMNDTFVQQITMDAKAAIDKGVETGWVDRNRILVSGHSYGAFMTANLLAHTNLFAAGIARSGAYNRTLTPFGFQSETRNYWEAKDIYDAMSPFNFADKVKAPILLIHGEMDNNSGTFPIQSQRFYEALAGFGATAKLVILPYEAHGYSAEESVLHVLAESIAWADKYVKNRQIPKPSSQPTTPTAPATQPAPISTTP